jgi:hypothetical protein
MIKHADNLEESIINFLVTYMLSIFGVMILISLLSMYVQYTPEPIPLDYDYVSIYQQLAC